MQHYNLVTPGSAVIQAVIKTIEELLGVRHPCCASRVIVRRDVIDPLVEIATRGFRRLLEKRTLNFL
jgi:hypothetical protein